MGGIIPLTWEWLDLPRLRSKPSWQNLLRLFQRLAGLDRGRGLAVLTCGEAAENRLWARVVYWRKFCGKGI
jgi:hypothetical protein